jgi:hypothetical protein
LDKEYRLLVKRKGRSEFARSGIVRLPRYKKGDEITINIGGNVLRVRVEQQTEGAPGTPSAIHVEEI